MRWSSYSRKRQSRLRRGSAARLDFTGKRQAKNPFIENDGQRMLGKRKRQFFLVLTLFGIMGMILLLHPVFQIKKENIRIAGLHRISEDEFLHAIDIVLRTPVIGIFARNNYLLIDTKELQEILLRRFPIHTVQVDKVFPTSLTIEVVEKPPTIIYDNGLVYATVDSVGSVVDLLRAVTPDEWSAKDLPAPIETSAPTGTVDPSSHTPARQDFDGILADYPIVYDPRPSFLHTGETVLEEEALQKIIYWHTNLTNILQLPVAYIALTGAGDGAFIKVREGWEIRVNLGDKKEDQFQRLQFLLRQPSPLRSQLQYIDLRFGSNVFWQ